MSADASTPDETAAEPTTDAARTRTRRTLLLSRVFVTWVELTLVGFAGAALAGSTSGPPQFVVFFATTLLTVAVIFHNVDRHVTARLSAESE
jgi:fatty acid desaturase